MTPLSLSNQHPLISSLFFLTPIVIVMGMLGILGVDGGNSPTSYSTTWCVARSDASTQALQTALDYACGAGADCSPIQSDGLCYLPNTIQAHASYAFDSYYQRQAKAPGSCGFSGTATIAQTDPSYGSCVYPSSTRIVRRSYDKDQDTFRHLFLLLPCLILALVINEKFTFKEVMWTFSIYLEAVAILPQLVLLQRTRNIDNLTGQYVFLLGAYRALYILNWIYRYFTEEHYVHWITWIAGIIQTLLYADFFYYYFQSWKNNVKLELPA